MRPTDAESSPWRPQTVGKRDQVRFTVDDDRDSVQLRTVNVALQNRFSAAREGTRGLPRLSKLVRGLDDENAPLAAGVAWLQHRRPADNVESCCEIVSDS